MQFDWTVLLNDLGLFIGIVGGIFGLNKKWPFLSKAAIFLEQNAGAIVQEAEAIGKAIIATPAGAIAAHSLHAEVDRVTEDFKKSEIARLALVGLHSFGQAADSLSDTQRVALEQFIINSVPKEWGLDTQTIAGYLLEAEKDVAEFSKDGLVQAANTFTEAQKASVAPIVKEQPNAAHATA